MTEHDPSAAQTLGFKAEVRELLHLMIHSLYSHREIFLRELVSNASDACDRLRFAALDDPSLLAEGGELAIDIDVDPLARTITIADNGIGMSREEVVANIGTIAKSGTREFVAALEADASKESGLIGQFGVGFYSAFLVADEVTLVTCRAGTPPGAGTRWTSRGEGEFSVEAAEVASRGTTITLHLREGMDEYLSRSRLAGLVRKYSDHIALPIRMPGERWDEAERRMVPTGERETVNAASALWTRPKSGITPEQYQAFYRHITHDHQDALAYVHARVEGRTEYTQLLFIPAHAPFDLWDREHRHGLKLYVRRVFVMDDAQELLPAYLRFVRGIVDANDLPLNVSREILQQSHDVDAIRNGVIKRVLGMLEELADNEKEKYATFWKAFGAVLKEGLFEDAPNRERLAKLARFSTTRSAGSEQDTSLADYVARMPEGQDAIWYVIAETHAAAAGSPHLEGFRRKGYEVLLLSDRVDEWALGSLDSFEGKPLKSVMRGAVDLSGKGEGDVGAKDARDDAPAASPLLGRLKEVLGDEVGAVRASERLVDSPACLVVDEGDVSAHLERLLRSAGRDAPRAKPILEVNLEHPLVQALAPDDARLGEWARVLVDQARLAEGGSLEDPARFVRAMNALLASRAAP